MSISPTKLPTQLQSQKTYFTEGLLLNDRNNITSETRYYQVTDQVNDWLVRKNSNETYQYDGNNHLTNLNGVNYLIDDNGNASSRYFDSIPWVAGQSTYIGTNINYSFDVDDRIIGITSTQALAALPVEYEYNGFNQRVRTEYPNENRVREFTWDMVNDNVIFETSNDVNGSLVAYHIYGATGLEATMSLNGNFMFHLGDLKGSVVVNTYSNDPQVNFYKYDDFGMLVVDPSGVNGNPFYEYRYLGKYGVTMEQSKLGHYNVKARHYDATIGRFLSEDPIWSTNLYPYSENNPISKNDPDGRESVSIFTQVGLPGHVFVEVNGVIFSYGRYGELYQPKLGPFSPTGEGILHRYANEEKAEVLKYPSRMFNVDVESSDAVYNYFNDLYLTGETHKSGGKHIDTYNLFTNNCTTMVLDGVRQGRTNFNVYNFIPAYLTLQLSIYSLWQN